jgi:hypothetical protein
MTVQDGILVEIEAFPHLGPRRVDTRRDHGEKNVDEPDLEVFPA